MQPLPCHIQVAKAGTNTARSLLQESVPPDSLLAFKVPDREIDGAIVTLRTRRADIDAFRERIHARQWELRAASLMLPVGVHFSFVREPVARCLSAINFVFNRRDKHPDAAAYAALDWSVSRIASSGGPFYRNDQVRMLSGSDRHDVGRDELMRAKDNIRERFWLLGTSDRFADCWPAIAGAFDFKVDAGRRLNAGDYGTGLVVSERDRAALRDANALDAELYAWVRDEYLPARLERLTRELAAGAS
jgi:hypothetical protein